MHISSRSRDHPVLLWFLTLWSVVPQLYSAFPWHLPLRDEPVSWSTCCNTVRQGRTRSKDHVNRGKNAAMPWRSKSEKWAFSLMKTPGVSIGQEDNWVSLCRQLFQVVLRLLGWDLRYWYYSSNHHPDFCYLQGSGCSSELPPRIFPIRCQQWKCYNTHACCDNWEVCVWSRTRQTAAPLCWVGGAYDSFYARTLSWVQSTRGYRQVLSLQLSLSLCSYHYNTYSAV